MLRVLAVIILAMLSSLSGSGANAQENSSPIPSFGAFFADPSATERPDPAVRYRVVFSVTKASLAAETVNPSLEKVARFLNLLAADGVRPTTGDIVAIVHGGATPIISKDEVYDELLKVTVANPNTRLIEELRKAGATVAVCGQALNRAGIPPSGVIEGVRIDVSALTTLATLQLRGWAIIPD